MSKNTNISELINYLSYDGSGNIVFTTVSSAASNTDKFLVSDAGTLKFRTAAQLLSDIGAQASGSYQAALSGTGFVKISGSTISYDNSTYATQTYVTTAISNLVAAAPSTLDTLNELASALGNDANFATTVATSIGTKQAQLTGTGFVKISGTTISYDNSTYALDSAVVKLAGTQSITGVKTFTGAGNTFTQNTNFLDRIYLRSASTTDYTNLSGHTNQLLVGVIGATHQFIFTPNTNYSYTFPAASGTLAFTSNLSSYVPYTGGTANVNLGVYNLSGGNININGAGSSGGALRLKQFAGSEANLEGYNSISTLTSGVFYFTSSASVPNFKNFELNPSGLTDNTVRTYALPDASGTLALTSNLSSYLPLAGGTITGPGLVIDRPASSSGEPYLFFNKDGTTRGSIYGGDGTAGLRFFSSVSTFIVNASSTITLASAGTDASMIKAGVGDELYLGGNNTWQMRLSGGNILMDNGGNLGIGLSNPQAILDVSHTAGTTNIIRVSNGAGNYRWRVDQNFSMIMTNASGVDTYSVNTSGGSIQKDTSEVKRSGDGDLFIGRYSSGSAKLVYAYQSSADGYLELRTGADTIVTKLSGYTGTPAYMNTKLTVGGTTTYSLSTLNVEGAIKANRSIYNWYQGSYTGNSTYLHIKTNMWCGGSPYGNSEYTMSLFKGYSYSYGTPPALEGTIVFHNWDGNFYNIGTTGNLFVTAYKSADGYVVLVTNSGSGESGVTIDWHQAYGYPFRDRTVSTTKLYGATTGGY